MIERLKLESSWARTGFGTSESNSYRIVYVRVSQLAQAVATKRSDVMVEIIKHSMGRLQSQSPIEHNQ
jgi:hypothetical protein